MIDPDQPNERRWVARATAGGHGLLRVNEDVLEHRGYRLWLSIAVGAGSRLPAVVRRLCAGRKFRPDTAVSFAGSPAANEAMLGASRANSVVTTIGLRADSRAGADAANAEKRDDDVIAEQNPFQAVIAAQFESRSYDDGLRAGVQARLRSAPITPYQRVGLDDFARGFRAGYFSSRARASQVGDSLEGHAVS